MLSMNIDIEHKTWDAILPYVTFIYNVAVQEMTQVASYKLVCRWSPATMLDTMLLVMTNEEDLGVASYLQLARLRIKEVDHHYNFRRLHTKYQPGHLVWVWKLIQRCRLCEKPLWHYFGPYKVLQWCGALDYKVVPIGLTSTQWCRARPEVHVLRLKHY